MTARYKQIRLEEAQPGMVLSDDLLDTQGNVLLSQGTVLNEPMLASLARHQFKMLPVLLGEISAGEQAARRAHHQARIKYLFRNHTGSGDPATEALLHYVQKFRLGGPA